MSHLILLFLCLVAVGTAIDCTTTEIVDGKSYFWDLTSLSRPKNDYRAKDVKPEAAARNQTYFWNICTNVSVAPQCAGAGVCQWSLLGWTNCGTLESIDIDPLALDSWLQKPVKPTDGVSVYYKSGFPYETGTPRQTVIHILCDKSATTPVIENNSVTETWNVAYSIFMRSAAACPTESSTSSVVLYATHPSSGSVIASNVTDFVTLWYHLRVPPEKITYVPYENRIYFSSRDIIYYGDTDVAAANLSFFRAEGPVLGLCGGYSALFVLTSNLLSIYQDGEIYQYSLTGAWSGLTACDVVDETHIAMVGLNNKGIVLYDWINNEPKRLEGPFSGSSSMYIAVETGIAAVYTRTNSQASWYVYRGILDDMMSPSTERWIVDSLTPVGIGISSDDRELFLANQGGVYQLITDTVSPNKWHKLINLVTAGLVVL